MDSLRVECSLKLQFSPQSIAIVHLKDSLNEDIPGRGPSLWTRDHLLCHLLLIQLHRHNISTRMGVVCACVCVCVCHLESITLEYAESLYSYVN